MLIHKNVFPVARVAGRGIVNNGSKKSYNTACVRLERDKDGAPVAVATDGRRLVVVRWEEPGPEDYPRVPPSDSSHTAGFVVNVSLDAWQEAQEQASKVDAFTKGRSPILGYVLLDESRVNESQETYFLSTDLRCRREFRAPVVEDNFPEWRKALPNYDVVCYGKKEQRAVQLSIDGKLLTGLIDAAMRSSGEPIIFLTVPLDTDKPLVVKGLSNERGLTVLALQMPLTQDRKDTREERDEKKAAKPKKEGFMVETRKIGNDEHWVIVDRRTRRVMAQQPVEVEFLSPEAHKLVRIKGLTTAMPEAVKEALEEAPTSQTE